GFEVGQNVTLVNSATGEIHGGSGALGYGIQFIGGDLISENALENDGLIDSLGSVAIDGGMGREVVLLNDGSTVVGDIRLNDGNDLIILDGDATLTGNVSLGAGSDFFVMTGAGFYDGDVTGGDGNDGLFITDTSTFVGDFFGGADGDTVEIQVGATMMGNVDLGSGTDFFNLSEDVAFEGIVQAGAGNDFFELGVNSVLTALATVALENGDDEFRILEDATIVGSLDTGNGNDVVFLRDGSLITGDLTMGDDDDRLFLAGAGTVGGMIDLGDGDDILEMRPDIAIPSNLILGSGVDTLHLVSFMGESAGTIDLGTASGFEALLIGPNAKGTGLAWTISTLAPKTFSDGVVLQTGDLMFDGTVQLNADFTQEDESTMVFDLGLGIQDSQLSLTGSLDIQTGADLEIRVDGEIIEGAYTLIETTGGIIGTFDSELFPNFATFDFMTEFVLDDLVLTVTRSNPYVDFARTSSEENVGEYLDEILDTLGTGGLPETITALSTLDSGELATALGQLHPEIYDAHTSSLLAGGRMHQRMLHERPLGCERFQYAPRPEIVSESPCGTRKFIPWAKVVGDIGRHSGGEPKGYDTIGGGVLLGVDHKWRDNIWFTGDIGFSHTDLESDNGAEGDFDTIDLGASAGIRLGALTLRSSMTYTHGFHETTRDVDFLGDRVKGKFDSDRVTLAASAGYGFHLGFFIVEPDVTIDYSHVEEESLKESGHDEVALDISSRGTDLFATTVGVRLSTNTLKYRYAGPFLEWADGVWSPGVSVHWRQVVGDVDRDQKAKMQGAPGSSGSFKSKASDSDGGVEFGAHLSFQPLKSSATFEIGYQGYFGDDVTNHSARATVRLPF
ncbi:MAG: autotransporter outer membrane beta-barrel domain-containing protein, partial [Deltaproteobacteria bacterium]|nr:autotransporter outer membrane beta-barrel domain-containing protein [Deltaproteobacteria bacterium]